MREWLAKALAAYVLHTPIRRGRGTLGKLAWWMYPYPILVKNEDGFSVKVKINDPNDRWVAGRCPEPHFERHVFVSYLQPGMTVIDAGANLGLYTLLISKKVGPHGRVYAFEPVPDLCTHLKDHLALNNATNVECHQCALSDTQGKTMITLDGALSSIYFSSSSHVTEVPTTTIDHFVAENHIARIDAIKVDVEGAELNVIRGADTVIRRDKPILFVEINFATLPAAGVRPEELFREIVRYGYAAYVIRSKKAIPVQETIEPHGQLYNSPYDNYIFLPLDC